MDFNWLLIISMGISLAKTDLNSHQLVSEPGFFSEISLLYQTENNGHCGIRASYYNNRLDVRESFQPSQGMHYDIRELVIFPFMGYNRKLFKNGRFYVDVGPQWQLINKMGLGGRTSYYHKIKMDKNKSFMIGVESGLDYWIFDSLDNYEDQTDFEGDVLLNFSISAALPLD